MKFQLINRGDFSALRWHRAAGFQFAAGEMMLPLGMNDLASAVMSYPIALVRQDNVLRPMALLGLQAGQNLFVSPEGRWGEAHIPAAIACYPFQLLQNAEGEPALAIDVESGLVDAAGPEAFFAEDGAPMPLLAEILKTLHATQQSLSRAALACARLDQHGLVVPWSIKVQSADGTEQPVEGLLKVDEAALNGLSAAALDDVRRAGGLSLAYCQMLSQQQLAKLGKLVRMRAAASHATRLARIDDGGTISFANL